MSHGVCETCHAYLKRQIEGLSLDRFLDGFDAPVLIIDGKLRERCNGVGCKASD